MSRSAIWWMAGVAGALAISGCARREAPPRPPLPAPAERPPVGAEALSPAAYVEAAASIDLFVIRASEMAASRAGSAGIRNLAAELASGHRGTSGQLSLAGRRLNLLPDASLQPLHRRMLDELTLSVAFDRLYVEHMRSVHRQSIALHSAFESRGDSPTLRPVARFALAVEREHLAKLGEF